jgi:hypothetical protein
MEIQQAATKAPEPRYMGVMDHNFVCTWTQRDPSIDTHKKGVRSSIPLKMPPSSGGSPSFSTLSSLGHIVQEQGGRRVDR